MAISPRTRYPGQTDVTDLVAYPEGAAQNVAVAGDGTGTPYEKDLVNDLFGFQQALLDAAGLSPSGTPDQVGASQYLAAVRAVAVQEALALNLYGGLVANSEFTASLTGIPTTGYAKAVWWSAVFPADGLSGVVANSSDDEITIAAAGDYQVSFNAFVIQGSYVSAGPTYQEFRLVVLVNGVETVVRTRVRVGPEEAATDVAYARKSVGANGIITVGAGAVVTLGVQSDLAASTLLVREGQLSIRRVR